MSVCSFVFIIRIKMKNKGIKIFIITKEEKIRIENILLALILSQLTHFLANCLLYAFPIKKFMPIYGGSLWPTKYILWSVYGRLMSYIGKK